MFRARGSLTLTSSKLLRDARARALKAGCQSWRNETELREALEKAFDYRGDVTLTQKDGTTIEGYIFDRVNGNALSTSFVRILPKSGGGRLKIAYSEIAALAFTGRDPAAGRAGKPG